jgi:energy-coupling factor transport system permease protein
MPLLEYEHGTTLFHRLSPMAKFLWGAIILLWLFLMFDPLNVLVLGALIIFVAKFFAGLSVTKLLKQSITVGVAGVFIIVFQGLLYPGDTVLFQLGPMRPTLEGVGVGLAIAFRIFGIVASSITIAKTTEPRDVFLTLVRIGVPYKFAYGLFTAIRFMPLMEYEAQTIRNAQYVRGIVPKKKGLRNFLKQAGNLLIPLVASGMRRAEQSSIAMDVRAFGMYPTRTYVRDLHTSRIDWVFVSLWTAAFLTFLVVSEQDILGAVWFTPD